MNSKERTAVEEQRSDVAEERRQAAPESADRRTTDQSASEEAEATPLFDPNATEKYQSRWTDIQARFVDDPKDAVKAADELVEELIKELSRSFAAQRENLERQWEKQTETTTEDFRQALRRYRSFFSRLLAL
jgi:hypothetical protein